MHESKKRGKFQAHVCNFTRLPSSLLQSRQETSSVRIGKRQNWKVSESGSVKIKKLSELESAIISKGEKKKELESVKIIQSSKMH